MTKKTKRKPTRGAAGGVTADKTGAGKSPRISPRGSALRKGGNPGGTNVAGNDRAQGNSHQGSSLGKRNSG
jgi:hypothetical protein